MSTSSSQRRFLIYGAFVGVVGCAALAWQSPRIAWTQWPAMLALAILAIAARRYAFTVGGLIGISLDTGVHFASVVILAPAGAALIAFISTVIGLLANPVRRYPWFWPRAAYVGFNGGMFALMQLVSGEVYVRIGGPHPALELLSLRTWLTAFAWALTYHLVNLSIAYLALLVSGRLSWQVVREDPRVFATEAMTLPVGALLIVVYSAEGLTGLALFGALLVVASALLKQLVETGDRLRGQLNSAAALTEAGQALAASLDADKIVELVYQLATKVLNARTFFVALYDQAQQELYFPVLVEEGARRPPARAAFEPGVGLTAHVIATRRSLLLNNAAEVAALPIRASPVSGKAPIESILIVPMIARERVLGVVSVQSVSRGAFSKDDLATLSTLAQQAAIAIDNADLVRNLAAQERLRQEMEIARKTQLDLLPMAPPQLPGLDIAGMSAPASVVGGDFFDYHARSDGRQVGIVVGDVSGHGMPAALLMTLTVGLLEAQSRDGTTPAELLTRLGGALKPHCARSRLNVAVCYIWAQTDGTVRAANAGSLSPLVRRAGGGVEWLEANGLPLGIELEDDAPGECETRLAPGDALVLITDGLVEAKNGAGEMFGFERFEQAAANAPTGSAAAVQEHILQTLRAFLGLVEPQDDVTVVVVVKR
jgi:serine phosphatase RsbU (regulator of sigma subunit)